MDALSEAIEVLRKGGVVAVPTDTVYGLIANALDEKAICRIYEIKRRPREKPLVLFLSKSFDLGKIVEVTPDSQILMEKYWPGPLTIVFRAKPGAPSSLVHHSTIGVRVPYHPILNELLEKIDFPLASTSANISGEPPLLTAEEVREALGSSVDCVLGESSLGQEPSTVVDLSGKKPVVLRKGPVPILELEETLGKEVALGKHLNFCVVFVCTGNTCRSPMAEFITKHKIPDKLRERIHIFSAGIIASTGDGINPLAREVLREIGIDVPKHRSRHLSESLVRQADIILGMEVVHVRVAKELGAGSKARLFGRKEYGEIEDPIGRGLEVYRCVRDRIIKAIDDIWLPYFLRKIG